MWVENDTYYVDCRDEIEEAFLAGLKVARQEKWHDLRKNPKDLPSISSMVLDEHGSKVEYFGRDIWWRGYPDYTEIDPPIAWCEIPKFVE